MASLLTRLLNRPTSERALVEIQEAWRDNTERLGVDFRSYAAEGYKGSGPVFACIVARMAVFSEVEFAYRDAAGTYVEGPLALRNPGVLLRRAIADLDLAGNAFLYRAAPNLLQRLRPDWVAVVTNDKEVTGYVYQAGGIGGGGPRHAMFPDEVAHWTFWPDPLSPVLGMSWLTSVAQEILSDQKMQAHKASFYANAATPALIFTFERTLSPESKAQIAEDLQRKYAGVEHAYRSIVMDAAGGKVDVHSVGNTFEQMDFARVGDQGETRIASAAGVPPIVVGFNSGLAAATYSNYSSAVRRFADGTIRPLWKSFVQALAPVMPIRAGMDLIYDDRKVPALQQDAKDDAEIENLKANTAAQLIRAGFEPDSVTAAVVSSKLELLTHTGNIPTALYNPAEVVNVDQPALPKEESNEPPPD